VNHPEGVQGRAFVDLHCHTSASFDSLARPASVVAAAARRGLTHLAITDHGRIDGALAARDAAPPELTIIVGEEVRTTAGDLIGLFIEHPVPGGLTMAEASQAIREQGGVVGLPHPFDRFRASGAVRRTDDQLTTLVGLLDYLEAWNARVFIGDGNRRAADFALAHGLPGVAVSDAHLIMEIGVAYFISDAPVETAEQLRAALPTVRLVTGRSSRWARTGTPLAKLVKRLRGPDRLAAR
jgi:predicted metal-dependent phosphoesterase TrpH